MHGQQLTSPARFACGLALAFVLANSPALAVDCEHVAAVGTTFVVCRADIRRDDLHVFLNDEKGQGLRTFDALERMLDTQGKRVAFAMNAGMFHANHAPVGLLVEQRQEIAPLNTANGAGNFFLKPNGVFFIGRSGARISESSQLAQSTTAHAASAHATSAHADIVLATQSGPLLVSAGNIHPRLNPTSTSLYIRNGVGIDAAGLVVFASSDGPLTLYDLATTFRDVLHCPDALYFDGSVSSVYAPSLKQRIQRADLGPIIAVVENKP